MLGKILANRYKIDAEIGHGGMGVVYRGYDTFLKRIVAIKVITTSQLPEQTRARLLSEAQAAAKLNHPNIITIYDVVEADGLPFIVMEFAEGGVLRFKTPPEIRHTIGYIRQISSALIHAHSRGVIHRDIKPDNILVSANGAVKITDFGLALNLESSFILDEGAVAGTLTYLAPEIFQGGLPSPRSDLYSLGVLMYELITGVQPFQGTDISSLIKEILMGDLIPPIVRNPLVSTQLNILVTQLLSRNPEHRPQSAQVVFEVLTSIQADPVNGRSDIHIPDPFGEKKDSNPAQKESKKDWRRKSYPKSSVPILGTGEKELIQTNRARELTNCISILNDHRLLVITGMPGIGKSTLARVLLERMPSDSPPPFWYDFDRQKGSGNTLGVLLDRISSYLEKVLGGSVRDEILAFRNTPDLQASPPDVDILTDYLNHEPPLWMVFDNLETVLTPGGSGFLDPGLDSLFDGLKSNTHNTKVIITSPLVPVLQDGELLLEFGSQPLTLQGLDLKFAVAFLRANGLANFDDNSLASMAQIVDGHPFALKHVARYVTAVGIDAAQENLRGGLDDFLVHFQSILLRRLSDEEYAVLKMLTVLQREIPMDGLCKTAQTRPALVKRLREAGLLEKNQASNFWVSPLVRLSLSNLDSPADVLAHHNASIFYRKQLLAVSPKEIDDYSNVLEWHYHAIHSNDLAGAYEAVFRTNLYSSLYRWNEYALLGQLCEQIYGSFEAGVPNLSALEWANLNFTLGVCEFFLGNPIKSAQHCETALDALSNQDEPHLAVDIRISHAEAMNCLGRYDQGLMECAQIFPILATHPDDFLFARTLTVRAVSNRAIGKFDSATGDFETACRIFEKLNRARQLAYTTGELGILYYFLNQFDKALDNYKRATLACEQIRDTRGEMVGHLNIGDVLLQQGAYVQAMEELSQALLLARRKKLPQNELTAGIYLAEAQIATGRFDEAQNGIETLRPLISPTSTVFHGHSLRLTAAIEWRQGRLEPARITFERVFELLRGPDCLYERSRALIELATFLSQTGHKDQARTALDEARQGFEKINNQLGLQAVDRALAN